MFAHTGSRGVVDVAFTDRVGGVSEGPFASLNLAEAGADDPRSVGENLARVLAELTGRRDAPVVRMRQVHGAEAVLVGAGTRSTPEVDGLVTTEHDVTLVVRVADCVPVLVADAARGVIGAFHAGRQGLALGIVPRGVAVMREAGAEELVAWVGPHVCGRCYEVPAALRDEVAAVVPEAFATTSWGTPALDVGAGVAAQLRREGAEVLTVDRCTREDETLYSYRRDGDRAGRAAGLIRVRP